MGRALGRQGKGMDVWPLDTTGIRKKFGKTCEILGEGQILSILFCKIVLLRWYAAFVYIKFTRI